MPEKPRTGRQKHNTRAPSVGKTGRSRRRFEDLQCAKLVRSLAASPLLASSMARDGLLMYITSFGRFKSDLSIKRIYRL